MLFEDTAVVSLVSRSGSDQLTAESNQSLGGTAVNATHSSSVTKS
jgi:hypothetical protein